MSGEGNVAPPHPQQGRRAQPQGQGIRRGSKSPPGELDALAALLGTHRGWDSSMHGAEDLGRRRKKCG